MTFDECCRAIVKSPKVNPYAITYARAGLGMTGDAARVQALYILSNLSGWRAPEAKAVRASLKIVGEVK
jgi:hypothetical protein